jgi:O-antigen/teichoic acid export membrane protein
LSRRVHYKNIASNWAQMGWGVVWGIVMVPLYLRYLGKSDYGIWLLIHAVVGYYGLIDLGVHGSVVRHVSRYLGLGDERSLREVFNTALAVQAATGVLALLVSTVLAAVLPRIEGFAASEYPQAGTLLLLVGATTATTFVGSAFRGALAASERFDLVNAVRMLSMLVLNLGHLAVLAAGGGLVGMAWVLLAVSLCEKPVLAVLAVSKVPGLRISPALVRRSRVFEIFEYGFHAFAVNAGEKLRLFTDSVVIGAFLQAEAIATFRIGSRPLQFLTNFVRGISRVLTPAFSRAEALEARRVRLLVIGTRATVLVATLGCLLLALAGDRLLTVWLGPGYEDSVPLLMLLIPGYLVETGLAPTGSALLGSNRYRVVSRISILEGLANLGLSLALIVPFGLVGVALGTMVPMLVTRLFILPYFACREVGLGLWRFMGRVWGPVAVPVAVGGAIGIAIRLALPETDLVSAAVLTGGIVLGYGLAALVVARFTDDELLPPRLVRWIPRRATE